MNTEVQTNSWVLFLIIFFCLIFIGIGIGMLIRLFKNISKAQHSKNWLVTQAEIISSGLDAETTTDTEGYQTTTYIANVQFNYVVHNQTFESNRINFDYGMRTSNRKKQQSIVDQYPVGRKVPVYYNPENPADSVLERKVDGAFTTILVSAVFITIGVIVAVSSLGENQPGFLKNLFGN